MAEIPWKRDTPGSPCCDSDTVSEPCCGDSTRPTSVDVLVPASTLANDGCDECTGVDDATYELQYDDPNADIGDCAWGYSEEAICSITCGEEPDIDTDLIIRAWISDDALNPGKKAWNCDIQIVGETTCGLDAQSSNAIYRKGNITSGDCFDTAHVLTKTSQEHFAPLGESAPCSGDFPSTVTVTP